MEKETAIGSTKPPRESKALEKFIQSDEVMKRWEIDTTTLIHYLTKGLPVYDRWNPSVRFELKETEGNLYPLKPYTPPLPVVSYIGGSCVFKLSELEVFAKKHGLPPFSQPELEHNLKRAEQSRTAEDRRPEPHNRPPGSTKPLRDEFRPSDRVMKTWRINISTLIYYVTEGLPIYKTGRPPVRLELKETKGDLYLEPDPFHLPVRCTIGSCTFKLSELEAFAKEHGLPPFGQSEKAVNESDETPREGKFKHSPDFRSVKIDGNDFTLTAKQAQVIQILCEAHEHGTPDISQKHIMAKVNPNPLGAGSDRLRDIFKSEGKAWKCLIRSKRKGLFRLNI
jgi:hypothetical protein